MPVPNGPVNKNRTSPVLENDCTEDGILLAFSLRCDIVHSSSQLLPEAVLVLGCGCLTAIWKKSWHHFVEGISQIEG